MSEFWKAFLLTLKLVIDSWSESGSAVVKAGLVTMACRGGAYTDEATQQSKTLQPHLELRAATIYSGTGPLTILASPLSYCTAEFTGKSLVLYGSL
jgi:hypothetical protein